MYTEIGAFDAKARLSELLRLIEEGRRFTITVRGKPVADLVPTQASSQADAEAAIEDLRHMPLIKGVSTDELLAMIREGRE